MKKLFSFLIVFILISCSKDPVIYTLTATANPAEGGTVSPSSQQYDSGDVATVTANPSAEYVFQSWSGSASGSSPSTTVTMDSDKAVVANFIKKKYALTINVEGEGSVTEKVIKAGLATDYNSGTIVELTAVPEGEWLFVEWKGDLTGSENPKQITIDKAKTVTAVFVKKQYPLTIEIEGEGTVTETVIKQGLATDYNSGTIVELTAEPTGDWEFVEWTGDITSTENPAQITIDGPKTVKVKFENMNLSYKKSVMTMDVENIYLFDRSLFIVSGALSYNISDINYILYPGQANWNAGQQSGPKEEIPAQPSYLFYQDENGYWNFKEKYDDALFWGPRNYEINGSTIALGDGNEIGDDWKGDVLFANINDDGSLDWTTANKPEEQGFFHGTGSGDLNGDGLIDIACAPGINDKIKGVNKLPLFIQQQDGSFSMEYYIEFIHHAPFSVDIVDLDGDGLGEIITADYGGGDPNSNPNLNGLDVYKLNSVSNNYEKVFESNNPTALYNIGMGATSIQVSDFNVDGIKDLVISYEDSTGHSFGVWLGKGNFEFEPYFTTPIYPYEEMQFREVSIIDVNEDGFDDIILRPHAFGNLYRIDPDDISKGVKFNHLIWINDGTGKFNYYDRIDLASEEIAIWNLLPYFDNGRLHFVGAYITDYNNKELTLYDFKLKIQN